MDFRKLMSERVVLLDGATGSNLQNAGMPVGVCPEDWVLKNERVFIDLQKKYIEAGSDVLYTMTFGCNRIKLGEYGLEDRQGDMIRELVSLSKRAVSESGTDRDIYVFGDISMTGQQLRPVGRLEFDELVDVYRETARYMEDAGVDGYAIETMMSLSESRAALLAVREVSDKPVIVTLTYESDGRTLYGTYPETAACVLEAMGADAVGINCSMGPDVMGELLERIRSVSDIPIVIKPNAGVPTLIDGKTCYNMGDGEFVRYMLPLIDMGADIVGGCCGTDERYIRGLKSALDSVKNDRKASADKASGADSHKPEGMRFLTTERTVTRIKNGGRFVIVGERINPTGKKALQEELRSGSTDMVMRFAEEQVENGAGVLDVNMGMSGIDEKAMMCRVVEELTMTVDVPLCIDSSDPDVIEAALRIYPGRALINSVSLEPGKAERVFPMAAKYGAMVILLPLTKDGLPGSIEEKHRAIDELYDKAISYGLKNTDLVVDGLVATVGANKSAALDVLETIRYCRDEKKLATICGLSNISFGLPERSFINTAFLTMAISNGLTMAISNPMQTLLTNAALASDLLMNKEGADTAYIDGVKAYEPASGDTNAGGGAAHDKSMGLSGDESELFLAVMKGRDAELKSLLDKRLGEGIKPGDIIGDELIPAITKVGELYEKKVYFLPQLIRSASTMEKAVEYLEPLMSGEKVRDYETVIMATVEGDVHDIGKNLVSLMLKNYGYNVIDLGKDVPSDEIIDAAERENAAVIGLSALMTTTMSVMPEIVRKKNERGLDTRVIVGGACVTKEYADEIGADGYSDDAADAVKLVNRLLGH
ncbi:MAG TPA: 5-methyltetrahydrofolate--homocysteine methyltransferase [Lachnospiraceae bacterium]|nr:5-methyltetrahydrofolate--homocysteine methyltransferase [Lachnospiraceae bacterium]